MKIVLISDNLNRELEYLRLLKKELEKKIRADVHIIGSIAEVQRTLYSLFKLKPEIVIMAQVQERSCRQIASYAKQSGAFVCLVPSEITISHSVGSVAVNESSNFDDIVDLLFLPGMHMKKFMEKSDLSAKKMLITGSPKIDVAVNQKPSQLLSRAKFQKLHHIPSHKLNIFIFSFPETSMEYFKSDDCFGPKMKLITKMHRGIKQTKNHYLKTLSRICRDFPEHNIIFKPHPLEKIEKIESILTGIDNLFLIQNTSITDCYNSIDLAIHWTSTISTECWQKNIKTIQYNPVKSAKWILSDFTPGNPLIETYPELKLSINKYLKSSLEKKYLNFQKKYFKENFYKMDGKSAQRIAELLKKRLTGLQIKTHYQPSHGKWVIFLIFAEKILGISLSRSILKLINNKYSSEYAIQNFIAEN